MRDINEFVAFDIETTGLSPVNNEIIEIAAVKYKNGQKVDSFHSLINPGVAIPKRITQITGNPNFFLICIPIYQINRSF